MMITISGSDAFHESQQKRKELLENKSRAVGDELSDKKWNS